MKMPRNCPFCHIEPEIREEYFNVKPKGSYLYKVWCRDPWNCTICPDTGWFESKEKVIKIWNGEDND